MGVRGNFGHKRHLSSASEDDEDRDVDRSEFRDLLRLEAWLWSSQSFRERGPRAGRGPRGTCVGCARARGGSAAV